MVTLQPILTGFTGETFENRIVGRLTAVAHGGGVNSGAMALALLERGIVPDFQLFADTGGERPQTYEHIEMLSQYLHEKGGFPLIQTVRNRSKKWGDVSLEEECLRTSSLPSIAYGWKKCSEKWKARPQNAALRLDPRARAEWKAGRKIVKLIGYDAGEMRRAKYPIDKRYECEYPLIEFGMFREECEEILARHGMKVGKSSCFFCPSHTKSQILTLAAEHPDLAARALHIEQKAKPGLITVNGLGRRLNWTDFLREQSKSMAFDGGILDLIRNPSPIRETCDLTGPETPEQDCGCYDG
jgi:hypothetical protein